MKVLSLNCQRGLQPGLREFLQKIFAGGDYNFILLQEANPLIRSWLRELPHYEFINMSGTNGVKENELGIAYRPEFELIESTFLPLAGVHYDPVYGLEHPAFSFLQARFGYRGKKVLLGSLHLHSGIHASVRRKEITMVKQNIASFAHAGDSVIFGGDCNFGLLGELSNARRILGPEFLCTTVETGPTLDSRYSEYADHIVNQAAYWASRVGLGINLKADNMFVDAKTFEQNKIACRVLPDRVSDHSPVEMTIS